MHSSSSSKHTSSTTTIGSSSTSFHNGQRASRARCGRLGSGDCRAIARRVSDNRTTGHGRHDRRRRHFGTSDDRRASHCRGANHHRCAPTTAPATTATPPVSAAQAAPVEEAPSVR